MSTPRIFSPSSAHPPRGFSLVEIMIGLAIGLFLLGGMIQLLLGTKQTYRYQDNLSRIQENGRFATGILSQDIRMTGYTGCPPNNPIVKVVNSGAWWVDLGGGALVGYDGDKTNPVNTFPGKAFAGAVPNPGDRLDGTDAVVFLQGGGDEYAVASHSLALSRFTLERPPMNLQVGSIVVVCDAQQTAMFQVTAVAGTNVFSTVGAGTPGNSAAITHQYLVGAKIVEYVPTAFYVGVGNAGGISRSLYRFRLQVAAGTPTMVSEELVEGIENMQIHYGMDTNNDGAVDDADYLDALGVTNWGQVLAVRANLLLSSLENNLNTANQWVMFPPGDIGSANLVGNGFTATDRRLYQVFSTTVGIRNRLRLPL